MRKNKEGRLVFEWDDVMDVIISLSQSQGYYGRLLRSIAELRDDDEEAFDELVVKIESEEFISVLDVIMYFEG